MLLVRVILFMMSRRAEDVGPPIDDAASDATDQSYRARLQSEIERTQVRPDDMHADAPLTREEMTQLFGKALRVR